MRSAARRLSRPTSWPEHYRESIANSRKWLENTTPSRSNWPRRFCLSGERMHTQVGIIGAGPAGLFLAHLLYREGIDSVVLEARSRAYVEDRVRAGVLEQGTVDLMHELGLDQRLRRESMIDEAIDIRFGNGKLIHVHFPELVAGKVVTIYGQQEVVKDLIAARIADGAAIEFEAEVTGFEDLDGDRPTVRYRKGDGEFRLTCNIIAGCDGFHGVCRPAIPQRLLTT